MAEKTKNSDRLRIKHLISFHCIRLHLHISFALMIFRRFFSVETHFAEMLFSERTRYLELKPCFYLPLLSQFSFFRRMDCRDDAIYCKQIRQHPLSMTKNSQVVVFAADVCLFRSLAEKIVAVPLSRHRKITYKDSINSNTFHHLNMRYDDL